MQWNETKVNGKLVQVTEKPRAQGTSPRLWASRCVGQGVSVLKRRSLPHPNSACDCDSREFDIVYRFPVVPVPALGTTGLLLFILCLLV